MVAKAEWRWAAIWSGVLVVASTLPYVIAALATPADLFYTGLLSNPEDGHAYLARMQQGLGGAWLYRLAFTAEPHTGAFLFTYYLFLGHVARWSGLPPILVFHLARMSNGFLLLLVLYYTIAHFVDRPQRQFAFLTTSLGSGLGWLAVLLGKMTVDLWVPEGYVFYSLFVNPHFPLAMAMLLLLIVWGATPWAATEGCPYTATEGRPYTATEGRPCWTPGAHRKGWRLPALALGAAILGVVQPFCLLTVGVVLLLYALVRWVRDRHVPWSTIASGVVIGAAGMPFAVNAYLASTRNPTFASWAAQNQTPSPPPWDYAVGYGGVLLLALVGSWQAVRRRRDSDVLLLLWTLGTALLLYAPFALQRRLALGLIVPLGILATVGWYALPRRGWTTLPAPSGPPPTSWGLLHRFREGRTTLSAPAGPQSGGGPPRVGGVRRGRVRADRNRPSLFRTTGPSRMSSAPTPNKFGTLKGWLVWGSLSLTHLFLIATSLAGALAHHEALFLTRDERAALDWLSAHAAPDALVIAAPQMGSFIPAWTGRRVFYGHRFETAHAEVRQAQLLAFFERGNRPLLQERPDYVFYGPREQEISGGVWQPDPAWRPAFQRGEVIIYAISPE